MIAPTPPLGWNSWNTFGGAIHEDLIKETADAFITTGLKDAGYEYVVIDDLWELDERVEGRLTWDPAKFPSGIPALADYVHGKGLKFGIYSCAGSHTCAGKPASYGYEEIDAQTFADWGVDFLKYDFCYVPPGVDGPMLYRRMGQALRATGRPILFSLCEWGGRKPAEWARGVGGHMWRTTGDITDNWERIKELGFVQQQGLEKFAGPNAWNDPDMLAVGMYGKGNVADGGCSDAEYRSHFALWCMLASPLMIGCDVRSMNDTVRNMLTTPGLLAINQDPMGVQGWKIGEHRRVWSYQKPLEDGSIAVGFFNLHDKATIKASVAWEALGLHDRRECTVRDAWTGQEIGQAQRHYTTDMIEPHDCRVVTLTPGKD